MLKLTAIALFVVVFFSGCGPNQGVLTDGKVERDPNAPTPAIGIDAEIEGVKTAGFGFVYVVRRKDGAVIDAGDKAVLKATTGDARRRIETDEGRAFIIANLTAMPPEKLAQLSKRMTVETVAAQPPPVAANANSTANANK